MEKIYKIWEDLTLISEKKLPYRTIFKTKKQKIESLNGEWSFKFFEDAIGVDEQFQDDDNFISENKTIKVPGCWELNGYGKPMYENIFYPMGFKPPEVIRQCPVGLYKREINIDNKDESKRYVLRLHGIDSAAEIWVNGKYVDFNKHARVTSEYDITKYLTSGKNTLSMKVYKYTEQSYLEAQDMWRFGGIFRDVELVIDDSKNIEDFYIKTNIASDLSKASLSLEINHSGLKQGDALIQVLDEESKEVQSKKITLNDEGSLYQLFDIDNPILWNVEQPYLYTLKITYLDNEIIFPFGLKKLEIRGKVLYINNVPLKIKGANRHDFSPTGGRVTSRELIEDDIKIMKQHNINAIRTAHYPSPYYLYELADKYGMWVMSESDIESHGAQHVGNWSYFAENPEWLPHYVAKTKQSFERDKNHVSIFSYSLGNEAGSGENFAKMADYIRSREPQAFVHYEGDYETKYTDVSGGMYYSIKVERPWSKTPDTTEEKQLDMIKAGKFRDQKASRWKEIPHVQCEYAHAMGNGPGMLYDYWQYFYNDDQFMGGFVWEWYDHGILNDEKTGYLYGGDFGELKHFGRFCIDGLLMPDRKPSPGLIEYKKVLEPIKMEFVDNSKVKVTNMLDYIDLSSYAYLEVVQTTFEGEEIAKYELTMPSLKRRETKEIELNLKESDQYYLVTIRARLLKDSDWAKKGHDLTFSQREINIEKVLEDKISGNKDIKYSRENNKLSVVNGDYTININYSTGDIDGIDWKGKNIIKNGNKIDLWRPLTDNDAYNYQSGQWLNRYFIKTIVSNVNSLDIQKTEDGLLKISMDKISMPAAQIFGWESHNEYIFSKEGVQVNNKYKIVHTDKMVSKPFLANGLGYEQPVKEEYMPNFVPKLGTKYELNNGYQSVSYFGKGDGETYPDSCQANPLGRYEQTIDDMFTPYVFPQDYGNKMNTKQASFIAKELPKISFESKDEFNFSAKNYTDKMLDDSKHTFELKKSDILNVKIDYEHSGLGAASCGPQQLKKDRVALKDFELNVFIRME